MELDILSRPLYSSQTQLFFVGFAFFIRLFSSFSTLLLFFVDCVSRYGLVIFSTFWAKLAHVGEPGWSK